MKFLTALLVLAGLAVVLFVILPVLGFFAALALPLLWVAVWLFPIVMIAASDKTTGGEKLAWILAIVFLSWFAWVFYLLLAPIKKRPDYDRSYDRYERLSRYTRDADYRPYRYR